MGARTVSVVVPATSANLGCAFDCAGLALNLYLRARATVTGAPGLEVTYRGEDAAQIPQDDTNLVVQSMRHAASRLGEVLPGFKLEVQNDIPLGVGLGSSAAAIVAGLLLGAELCGTELGAADLLRLALEIEGHPDNLAAAIHGGMVVSATSRKPIAHEETPHKSTSGSSEESAHVLVAKAPVSVDLDFVVVVPNVPLPTEKARAALPATYSRQDVVANIQRTALMTAAFFSDGRLTPEMFVDRIHQPYRAPLIPGIAECLEYRHAALQGVFISGAGSAVMAIVDSRENAHAAKSVGEALVAKFAGQGTSARALMLKADNEGTQLTTSSATRNFPVQSPA
jgi:homoserine kinase